MRRDLQLPSFCHGHVWNIHVVIVAQWRFSFRGSELLPSCWLIGRLVPTQLPQQLHTAQERLLVTALGFLLRSECTESLSWNCVFRNTKAYFVSCLFLCSSFSDLSKAVIVSDLCFIFCCYAFSNPLLQFVFFSPVASIQYWPSLADCVES